MVSAKIYKAVNLALTSHKLLCSHTVQKGTMTLILVFCVISISLGAEAASKWHEVMNFI